MLEERAVLGAFRIFLGFDEIPCRKPQAVQVIHEGFQYSDNEPDAFFYLGEAYSGIAEEAVAKDDFAEARKNYELAFDAYKRCLEIDRDNQTSARKDQERQDRMERRPPRPDPKFANLSSRKPPPRFG